MSLNLPVQALDYKDFRQSFVDFLRADPAQTYKDFNFEASGISTQMNLLAYNSHMIGFYVKMLLDEAFVDTAHTRAALLSHAKRVGYVPKGKRGARAELELLINIPTGSEPISDSILIPRGTSFSASNNQQDSRTFQTTEDIIATKKTVVGAVTTYTTTIFQATEGKEQVWKFLVNTSVINQAFVIKDKNLDIDSLRVKIKPNENSSLVTELKVGKFINDITPESDVYYISTNEDGFYQLLFGGGVYGFAPSNGNVIEAYYISSNGADGNGAKSFTFSPPPANPAIPSFVGNFSDFDIIVHSPSSGGMDEESVENLRTNIPTFYKRQGRLVTEGDFKSILLEEFRNIDSLNVWGGEKNYRKDYGKIYCSIKPRNALVLSATSKNSIKESILMKYGIVGSDVVFVDPEYISVDINVVINLDRSKTNKSDGEVRTDVITRITQYGQETLNKFESSLSDLSMLTKAKAGDNWIASLYSVKKISKDIVVLYKSTGINSLNYGNSIRTDTVVSSYFSYGGQLVQFFSSDNKLFMRNAAGILLINENSGTVNADTGEIQFKFPQFATIPNYVETSGVLTWTAEPVFPDVRTQLNNIVKISSVMVSYI